MWLQPLILVALGAWAVYATEALNPAPGWEIAAALFVGAVAGLPFGVLRGMHTEVRPTERPGVMYLGSSWVTIAIFVAAFGLRAGVRALIPHRGNLSSAIGDGLLAFAITFIAASYVVIFRKYEAQVAGAGNGKRMSQLKVLVAPGKTITPPTRAAGTRFDYPATEVGASGNVTVYYDSSLGASGLAIARQLLASAGKPYDDMQSFFAISGAKVDVVIAPLSSTHDGSGGAYHYGCDFTSGGVLYLDAAFAATVVDPLQLQVALYVAELSECFMGLQNLGWGCGYSNGEGLSRFCAETEASLQTLQQYYTGPSWAQAGFTDWVSQVEQTDGDAVSTGCAIVYLYWLRSLGYTATQIVAAAGATLADNYKTLTGKTTAYQDLHTAVSGLSVTSDNPFQSRGGG
jgi:hypothetical protein